MDEMNTNTFEAVVKENEANEMNEMAEVPTEEQNGSNPFMSKKFIVGAITAAGFAGAAITAGVNKLLKKGKEKKGDSKAPKTKKKIALRNPFYTVEVKEVTKDPEKDPKSMS